MRRLVTVLGVLASLVVVLVALWARRNSDHENLVGLSAASVESKPGWTGVAQAAPVHLAEPKQAVSGGRREDGEAVRPAGQTDASAQLDPRLARLRIVEEQSGAGPEPSEVDAGPTHNLITRITDRLHVEPAGGKLGYRGEMTARFPTAVASPTSGRAAFGPGDEVTSRFRYVHDEKENYCIHEETHSKRGKTKFDGVAYNGDWCYVDGQYGHLDLVGHRASPEEIVALGRERQGLRFEPFVMRTLRELLAENEPLIRFDPMANETNQTASEGYGIEPLPPEARQVPTEVKSLTGEVRFASPGGPLQFASLSGEVVFRSGTMSGAPLSFTARITAIPTDQLSPVTLP